MLSQQYEEMPRRPSSIAKMRVLKYAVPKAIKYSGSWGKDRIDRFVVHLRHTHVGDIMESWAERLRPLPERVLSDNPLHPVE